ncbi:phosphatase PAP2 family protein [Taklimakanibacter lacteus]|uniref:phosphatase PAP2 family protein n=1 Tax=Taklimakanibacter lacteus TaxID=2268456 RepID=UPI000E662178
MNTTALRLGRGPLSGYLAGIGRAVTAGFRLHALAYALATGALIIAVAAAALVGRLFDTKWMLLFTLPVIFLMGVGAFWFVIRELFLLWWTGYQGSPTRELGRRIASDLVAPQRLANIFHAAMLLSIFMSAFNTLKVLIPILNPFQWDPTFMEWDRLVHFGVHPYDILQPLLGHPQITFGVNFVYNLWYFVMLSVWMWQCFAKEDSALRQRFLVAFIITWFLGTNVLGTIFSSVGPTFYGRLLGEPDPFLPLMTYLRETAQLFPLWAVDTQDALWESYIAGQGLVAGISAMPSMHVGSSVLLVIIAFAAGKRRLGWCLSAFTAVIFLGSIHLAWHYAIDGYAGAAVALVGWYVAGWLVRWDRARQGIADA